MSSLGPSDAGRDEGERLKFEKTGIVARRRRVWTRRVGRALLTHLMEHQTGSTDDIRGLVDAPADAGTAFWGAAVLGLRLGRIITAVDRVVSNRPSRHACEIRCWRLAVEHAKAKHWLDTHPDLPDPEPGNDDGDAEEPCPALPTPPSPIGPPQAIPV
jgi:hypothetical protein